MKTGDIALVRKFRLQDEPFKLMSVEPITIPGKVVSVHYPSFTVKFDKPMPGGAAYQEFHLNHIPESVTTKDGNLTTVLSVIADIIAQAKQSADSSKPEKTMNDLVWTLMRLEAICKEHTMETGGGE